MLLAMPNTRTIPKPAVRLILNLAIAKDDRIVLFSERVFIKPEVIAKAA